MTNDLTIPTAYTITLSQISYLLCDAFDPVCNAVGYWCEITGYIQPSELTFPPHGIMSANLRKMADSGVYRYQHWPLNKGGAILLKDIASDKGETYELNSLTIRHGLEQMASKYPTRFMDILNDRADGDTADIFVQCCLFDEIIYG